MLSKSITSRYLFGKSNQSMPLAFTLFAPSHTTSQFKNINSQRLYSSTSNGNNSKHEIEKKRLEISQSNSPVYHQNSTLYSYTPREVLERIDREFVMPPIYVPVTFSDKLAHSSVKFLRKFSNLFFREKYVSYAIILETIAAVPGMVAGMMTHLKVLRNMENNNWIKILLDESENERMHLLSFMELTKPNMLERGLVAVAQGVFWNLFLICYFINPKTCHRFVGYLEEQAVISYTNFLRDLDAGLVKNVKAPPIAIEYWGLPADATLRDLILVIRQDEVDHRHVNHEISDKIKVNSNDPIRIHNHFLESPETTNNSSVAQDKKDKKTNQLHPAL
ncbi:hypothetical protein CYY_004569 [Polysphondylium violaceum]|uniref:Alternative oxidase n=1 Tax=Polysphondylium violaceum TaxID=133409 RepID=A0A8J4PWE1_9MYCE|nr:hypothetical protein CYY_004569 [Polysphondylium violaceum]